MTTKKDVADFGQVLAALIQQINQSTQQRGWMNELRGAQGRSMVDQPWTQPPTEAQAPTSMFDPSGGAYKQPFPEGSQPSQVPSPPPQGVPYDPTVAPSSRFQPPPQIFDRQRYSDELVRLQGLNPLADKAQAGLLATAPKPIPMSAGTELATYNKITGEGKMTDVGVPNKPLAEKRGDYKDYITELVNGVPVPKVFKSGEGGSFLRYHTTDAGGNPVIANEIFTKPSAGDLTPMSPFPDLSGQPLLKALDNSPDKKEMAAAIKLVLKGNKDINSVTANRGYQKQFFVGMVGRVDPTYDERWFKATSRLLGDATTGNIAKNARSLSTAVGHLKQFRDAAEELNNVDLKIWNTVSNFVLHNTGDPRVIAVREAAKALKAEMASATKGGASGAAGTETEIKDWGEAFDDSFSKGQFDQVFSSTLDILGSRIGALYGQVTNVPEKYKGMLAGFTLLSPPAKQILDNYGFDMGKYTGQTPVQQTSKTLSPQDQQAYDWAKANPNDARSAQILKNLGMK